MARTARAKLPQPVGYTTLGGTVERDLFLIRTARDLSPSNRSYYMQLEARRFDAELLGATGVGNQTTAIAMRLLTSNGLVAHPAGQHGAVLHRTVVEDLPPRLRNEIANWSIPDGQPPSLNSRTSVVPWMLLARLVPDAHATAAPAIPIPIRINRRPRRKEIIEDRLRDRYGQPTPTTVARVLSHIAELGQPRYGRYARYEKGVVTDEPAPGPHIPASMIGLHIEGTRQELPRGSVTADLEWTAPDRARLKVVTAPSGSGHDTCYMIPLTLEEMTPAPTRHPEPAPMSEPSPDTPSDEDWASGVQGTLDIF